jgi:hypothetical protein
MVADNMRIGRAGRNLLKGDVGKAALALIQSINRLRLLLVQFQGKPEIVSLLVFTPLV